jgi:hypothetical protein
LPCDDSPTGSIGSACAANSECVGYQTCSNGCP